MLEHLADQAAGIADQLIAALVPEGVVGVFQVVDVAEGNPKTPFVQVIGAGTPEAPFQIDGTKTKIMRVLNKNEVEDMLKAIKKMAEKK